MAQTIKLKPYEAITALPLQNRTAGTYSQNLWAEGQALLSTVFVQSIDVGATVTVTYYDRSLGDDLGEEMLIGRHDVLSSGMQSNKKLFTRFHNKPFIRAVVSGGSATFGIYISIVDASSNIQESIITPDKILSAEDKVVTYSYEDFGTRAERVDVIEYSSATVGATLRRTFLYSLVSGKYRLDSEVWEIL
jgi:hypothetical protein